MRLINTKTLRIEEFFDGHAPKYAILSHRWLDGEVTLQEMQAESCTNKPGYQKILSTCKQALSDGLSHAWIDTCCIDKTSSAELSEAINSMYRWYAEAEICYAFLNDIAVDDILSSPGEDAFAKSMWFSRGWTLQELVAPEHVTFYNTSWIEIGTKASLRVAIAAVTQIDVSMLQSGANLDDYSIARRMSWASRRMTTRKEDMAYCLLGIFNVNMPMLYGEGDRAFIRLQEEIMKNSDDHSLFAWSSPSPAARGLLARSPADFATCASIDATHSRWNREPYAISNLGLKINLPMVPWAMDTYLAALDCARDGQRLGIFLRLLPRDNRYARVMLGGEDLCVFRDGLAQKCTYRDVFVQQRLWGSVLAEERFYGFWMRTLLSPMKSAPKIKGQQKSNKRYQTTTNEDESLSEVITRGEWDDEKRLFELKIGDSGTAGAILLREGGRTTTIKVGLDGVFNPRVQVGGSIFSPEIGNLDIYSEAGRLHPSWMDAPARSMYLFRGTRLDGLLVDDYPWRISVYNGVIPKTGRMGWIVDIENSDGNKGKEFNRICDGCNSTIYKVWHKCTECDEFDYCSKCVANSEDTHNHKFEAIT
ncbi:hypothetical protein VE01_09952 [Pseudogymnoascus verrucosus]|uniref:ZZ-type domain-containing protein n=1 Tax=Pseudogymnoascus verrucosus TaxID=342668 RepID=A0A1B8G850_9PEZI|nr:uncharacterized protein VE01_09952 [Pseudogymnoascus verrucosus]OBT92006.1 hypothetical protein VE01_09952 [Pseudogymnoascus verrucosus]